MKRIFFSCTALALLLAQGVVAERVLIDRVAAVVNGATILHSEVQKKIDSQLPVDVSSFPATKDDPIFEQSLQDSVNFLLVKQEAEKHNINFDDSEIESEIKKTFAARGWDFGSLLEDLRQRGVSYEEYKNMYYKSMILRRFQQAFILPQIKITDKDLEMFFLKRTGQKSSNLKVSISQIFIAYSGDSDSEVRDAKKNLANKIYRDLQGGLSFAEAVNIYSDDTAAKANQGSMGTMQLDDLVGPIRKAIEPLKEGEYSRPVETGNGFHIFRLDRRQFSGSAEFEQLKPRLENELRMVQVEAQTQKWIEQKRQRSEVKIIR